MATALAATPVLQGKYYTAYRLDDVDLNSTLPRVLGKYLEGVDDQTRAIFESPSVNYDIPEDSGGNFGDIEVDERPKNGTLIGRDTIVIRENEGDLYILYTRTFPGYYIEDMRVINVGRERAWGGGGLIGPEIGFVVAGMYVKAGNEAKLFVEVFAKI